MNLKFKMQELKNKIILAPMAGVTNEPFRISLKDLGLEVSCTEMVSVEGLSRKIKRTLDLIDIKEEKPIIIPQLFGTNVEAFLKSIEILIVRNFNIIDINLGCPAKKIIKKGAGVALMNNPKLIERIISEIKKRFSIKLTAKLRLGFDENSMNYLEIVKILYNEGIDAITLHPRFGKQYYSGCANWYHVKVVKKNFPDLFVIGNGDIKTPEDIKKIYSYTNCDAVMIGRAFLENPFLIIQWKDFVKTHNYKQFTVKDKIKYFKTLFGKFDVFYGKEKAIKISIKHIIHLTKGLPNSARFREKISKIKNCIEFFNEISYWE